MNITRIILPIGENQFLVDAESVGKEISSIRIHPISNGKIGVALDGDQFDGMENLTDQMKNLIEKTQI